MVPKLRERAAQVRSRWAQAPVELVLIPLYIVGGLMAVTGLVQEVVWLPLGQLPGTPEGLLAVALLVALAGSIVASAKDAVGQLRPQAYPAPPNRTSLWVSLAIAVLAGFAAWQTRRWDAPWSQPLLVATVVFFLAYLIVGWPWAAMAQADWVRDNALAAQEIHYVVEGSHDQAMWQRVARVGSQDLARARTQAHATFRHVRFWTAESHLRLTVSHAGGDLLVGEPVPLARLDREEMRAVLL